MKATHTVANINRWVRKRLIDVKEVGTLSPIFGPNYRFCDTIIICCENAV